MIERLRAWIGPLCMLCILIAALWLLHLELSNYQLSDFVNSLSTIPRWRMGLAVALTCLSYVILFAYDFMGLWYIRHPMAWNRVALASFLGYAVGNNFGTLLGGSTIRLRLYTSWGLSAIEIVKLLLILSVTFWIGLFALVGLLFLVDPLPIPERLHLPIQTTKPLGFVFGGLAIGYLAISLIRKAPIRYKAWELPIPPFGLSLLQYLVAAVDLTVCAAILYCLMPDSLEISFIHFLSIYLLALVIGVLSHVPGGLSVIELVIMVLLSPSEPHAVIGSLLAFRAIYYLIPLMIGLVVLGANELIANRHSAGKAMRRVGRWTNLIAPRFLSLSVFAAGIVLLFSGATPADESRLKLLRDLLPLPVIEISHLLGSVAGILLLILARALQRRIETAYFLVVGLLTAGIAFCLLKGFDYEEAIILGLMLLVFAPAREHYYRKGSLFVDRLSPRWFGAIGLVLVCALWLAFFSFKHVEYKQQMWWQFAFSADAPRSLRALATAVLITLFIAASRLMTARPPTPSLPTPEELQLAAKIVSESPNTNANLALLGDKYLMFNETQTAFIMYGIEGRSWIAMGDPVGKESNCRELVWRFRERCDEGSSWPVFYQVDGQQVPMYVEMGLTLIKLGEEAKVDLKDFSLSGGDRKNLRKTHRQLSEAGCTFEVIPYPIDDQLMNQLKEISDSWLGEKSTAEKGFSLGWFRPEYVRRYPIAVIRKNDKLIAFANLWLGAGKEELSPDLMRQLSDAPNGTMEFLFINIMLWGQEQGYRWFNLGMAPLSGVENRRLGPLWNRVATIAFRHGEHFYNFQGLRQYKDKFDPAWSPKYLASPGGLKLPIILANLATLISGGLRGLIKK